jgi:hypothetical protein
MVVDDLRALPRRPLVVAEGSPLPAAAVPDRARAVWLLPTPEVQLAQLAVQGAGRGARELALLLAETIAREAYEHELPTLVVDGSRRVDATVAAVEELFADGLAAGPRAETATERRALLREANESIVAQVRGYYARPWADGDPDEVVRAFLCECGDPACDLGVEVAVGLAVATPVLAAEHR